jgi:hypothetical protein
MQITIDMEDLNELVAQADEIFLNPKAERVLLKLIDLRGQIETAIDQAKVSLEAAALKANPNFKSIRSEKIKVFYRSYGSRFSIDEAQIANVPQELYTTEVKRTYAVETDAVEKYLETHKGLPLGLIEKDRPKKLAFDKREKTEVAHGK